MAKLQRKPQSATGDSTRQRGAHFSLQDIAAVNSDTQDGVVTLQFALTQAADRESYEKFLGWMNDEEKRGRREFVSHVGERGRDNLAALSERISRDNPARLQLRHLAGLCAEYYIDKDENEGRGLKGIKDKLGKYMYEVHQVNPVKIQADQSFTPTPGLQLSARSEG